MLRIARPAVVNGFGVQYRSVDDFLASQVRTVARQIGELPGGQNHHQNRERFLVGVVHEGHH